MYYFFPIETMNFRSYYIEKHNMHHLYLYTTHV